MIIAENQVIIPGRKYTTKVTCVSTRRLTTVEWLLLTCTKKFSEEQECVEYKVKDIFENVFQFQNSELLIKPCINSLADLRVIIITPNSLYDFSTLLFSQIKITEIGQEMLKEGLLPGEQRDVSMDIYYNPLTQKISTFDVQGSTKDNCVEFGTESDYNYVFPKEIIIEGLQSGKVASGRFTAAKFRIESIDTLSESEWSCNTDISVDLAEDYSINTIPEIKEKAVYSKVIELLTSKEISDSFLSDLIDFSELDIHNIIGSGNIIKQSIKELCNNSKVILINDKIYEIYKRNTSFFKNKTTIIWGANEEFHIEVKKEKRDFINLIYIPDNFPIDGVAIMNEKEECISLCRANWYYKDMKITVPVASYDKRTLPNNKVVEKWIKDLIINNFSNNSKYLVLLSLPGISANSKSITEALENKWESCQITEIINDCSEIIDIWNQLNLIAVDFSSYEYIFQNKLDFKNIASGLEQFKHLVDSGLIQKKSRVYKELVYRFLDEIDPPKNYTDLIDISQKLGISSSDNSISISKIEEKLYTRDVIEDILSAIVQEKANKLPNYYNWDLFFSDYISCIKYVEAHLGSSLFQKYDDSYLSKSIKMCPNIASYQMYNSELSDKNAYMMSMGINARSMMEKSDKLKADAFFENISKLKDLLKNIIDSEYNFESLSQMTSDNQKVYVIDTCAMIHHPEIFLYFAEDEYVRIPTKVIDELGKIKDKRSEKYSDDVASIARTLAKKIREEYLSLFNASNKVRFIIENADLNLLPKDLDPYVPDNQILSVALKYSTNETTIISDDTAFLLTSLSQNVKTMTGDEFITNHMNYYKTIENWKRLTSNIIPKTIKPSIKQDEEEEIINISDNIPVSIDDLPIRELMKYASELTNPIMSLLNTNSIKTIGQFKQLTPDKIDALKAKGKQRIYKNPLKQVLTRIDQIIEKIESSNN